MWICFTSTSFCKVNFRHFCYLASLRDEHLASNAKGVGWGGVWGGRAQLPQENIVRSHQMPFFLYLICKAKHIEHWGQPNAVIKSPNHIKHVWHKE